MITWPQPHIHRPKYKKDGLTPLVAGGVVRHIAITLLGLFSPIYIYQSFSELTISGEFALSLTLMFYIVLLVFKMLTLIYSEDLSQRIGFKGVIWLSFLPFLLFLPVLMMAKNMQILFLPASILWGIHAGFFWWGYHGYFIKKAKTRLGLKIGEIDLFQTIASFSTPVIGAIVTTQFGFNALFAVSGVIMAISILVLGKKYDQRQKHDVKLDDVLRLIVKKRSVISAYAGRGGELHTYSVIWPLFLFLIFGRVLDLGIIVSLAALIASLFAVVVGKLVDERGEKWAISIGAPVMALSWLVRYVRSVPLFVMADSVRFLSQKLVGVPLMELSYKKAQESTTGTAMLFREFGLTIGGVGALLIVIIMVNLNIPLTSAFFVAVVFSLLPVISVIKKKI